MNIKRVLGAIISFGEQVADLADRLDGVDERARKRVRKLAERTSVLEVTDVATDARINGLDERLSDLSGRLQTHLDDHDKEI